MASSLKPEALSPSSTGEMTPLDCRSPTQSCAPTMRSGPSPVGAWAMKSVLMSCDGFWTTSRVTPVDLVNDSPSVLNASMRVSSTHTVRLPEPAGAEASGLAAGLAGVVAPVAAGEPVFEGVPPPQAASDRVSPAAATAIRLLRMCFSLFVRAASVPPVWTHRNEFCKACN